MFPRVCQCRCVRVLLCICVPCDRVSPGRPRRVSPGAATPCAGGVYRRAVLSIGTADSLRLSTAQAPAGKQPTDLSKRPPARRWYLSRYRRLGGSGGLPYDLTNAAHWITVRCFPVLSRKSCTPWLDCAIKTRKPFTCSSHIITHSRAMATSLFLIVAFLGRFAFCQVGKTGLATAYEPHSGVGAACRIRAAHFVINIDRGGAVRVPGRFAAGPGVGSRGTEPPSSSHDLRHMTAARRPVRGWLGDRSVTFTTRSDR